MGLLLRLRTSCICEAAVLIDCSIDKGMGLGLHAFILDGRNSSLTFILEKTSFPLRQRVISHLNMLISFRDCQRMSREWPPGRHFIWIFWAELDAWYLTVLASFAVIAFLSHASTIVP